MRKLIRGLLVYGLWSLVYGLWSPPPAAAAPTNLPPSIVRGLSYNTNTLVVVYHDSGTGDVDNVSFWRANSNGIYLAIEPLIPTGPGDFVSINDPAYLAALTNAAFAAQDGVTVDGRTLNIGTNLLGGAGGGGGAWDSFYGAREDLGVGLVISWIPTKWTGKWSPSNNAAFNMHPTNTYPRGTFSLWHYPTTTNRSITFEPSVSVQTVFTPTGTNLWIFTPGDTVTNWLAVGRSF